ncbi:MAG TPA: hypothetical protein VMS64_37390 [Candidatus Methylomirabilis sp.]|nr:hypothetical protein [Candidatus Methylomirabilis sp.]
MANVPINLRLLIRPAIEAFKRTLEDPKKMLKAAQEYGPIVFTGVRAGWTRYQQFRPPAARGIHPTCKTCLDDHNLVGKEHFCIARLGEVCFLCKKPVDGFGQRMTP